MELTRRDMLKMSLLGSAALALPLERVARTQLAVADRLPESQLPTPFQTPFVTPPVAQPVHKDDTTDYYEMTMKEGFHQIIPGLPKTEVWGYDGLTPGPTIVTNRGRNVVVRHKNEIWNPLHEHTSVHLHGNASLPQYDGYANDTTRPGEFKDYRYPNGQDARTLWYHDHAVHATAQNAYMGCAAFYISHDERELSLTNPADGKYKDLGTAIPGGAYDIPLVLRDATFATDGSMIFDLSERGSIFGDVILTNGVPWPVMEVERRKYRFRFLNASISRGFDLALSTGEPMSVIGHDGGLAPRPVEVGNVRVGMAERYEIVIDFSGYAPGSTVDLNNRGLTNVVDFASTNKVMRFKIKDTPPNATPLPLELNPDTEVMNLQESQSVRTRRFEFGRETVGGEEMWTINGRIWDPNRVDANPDLGDVEIWEFENKSGGWFHPIHVHLVDFKILDRSEGEGKPRRAPYAWENGPKDTAYVAEGEIVRVLMKFGPHKGRYMIHCHNLIHEDHDMMTQFEVGKNGPAWSSDPAKPKSEAGPLWVEDPEQTDPEETTSEPTVPVNSPPVISILRPGNGTRTKDRTPTIIARVRDSQTRLAKTDIKLFVDGREVKNFSYNRITGHLTYTCKRLRLGWHGVKIEAEDAGGRATVRAWRFRVVLR